jgi:uncharacterized membrane protein
MTPAKEKWSDGDLVPCSLFAFLVIVGLLAFTQRVGLLDSSHPWAPGPVHRTAVSLHGMIGTVAMILGPFQFSKSLRANRPRIHRVSGWIYILSVTVVSVTGYLIAKQFSPNSNTAEVSCRYIFSLLSLVMAIVCVRGGDYPAHRIWMMRSYGLLLTFFISRIPELFLGFKFTLEQEYNWLWALDLIAVLLPDVYTQAATLLYRKASHDDRQAGFAAPRAANPFELMLRRKSSEGQLGL